MNQTVPWFFPKVQMTRAHSDTLRTAVCSHHYRVCVCVAMHLSCCQLAIDRKRLDCVCSVGRADKVEHSPGAAGCSLSASTHASRRMCYSSVQPDQTRARNTHKLACLNHGNLGVQVEEGWVRDLSAHVGGGERRVGVYTATVNSTEMLHSRLFWIA